MVPACGGGVVNTVILTTLMSQEKIMFNLANIIAITLVPQQGTPFHDALQGLIKRGKA